MSKAVHDLREALYATGMVQPLNSDGRGGAFSCLCRQLPGRESEWLQVVDKLLQLADDKKFDLHVCRRYVRRDGRMVFGWFIGVEAKSAKGLVETLGAITEALMSFKASLTEETAPLPTRAPATAKMPQRREPEPEEDDDEKEMAGMSKPVKGTDAPRRPPNSFTDDGRRLVDPVAPANSLQPRLTSLPVGYDGEGKPRYEEVMPLPHTYKDLNKPQKANIHGNHPAFQKGARPTIGES